jgi:hypothetical protein
MKIKESLLMGKSIRQSMKDAGFSAASAHGNCDRYEPIVKQCLDEIMTEAKKRNIIDKAWKVFEEGLEKSKNRYVLAKDVTVKDMTEKQDVTTRASDAKIETPDEIMRKTEEIKNRLSSVK